MKINEAIVWNYVLEQKKLFQNKKKKPERCQTPTEIPFNIVPMDLLHDRFVGIS